MMASIMLTGDCLIASVSEESLDTFLGFGFWFGFWVWVLVFWVEGGGGGKW